MSRPHSTVPAGERPAYTSHDAPGYRLPPRRNVRTVYSPAATRYHRFTPAISVTVILALFIRFLPVPACADDAIPDRLFIWTVQGNLYHGSIVGRDNVDGITGASDDERFFRHTGTVGAEFNLKGHFIQAMLTYGRAKQDIHYDLPEENMVGDQHIDLYLLDIPVMYNFHLHPRPGHGRDNPTFILSPGVFLSFVLSHRSSGDITFNDDDLSPWAAGIFLRAAYFPFRLSFMQIGLFMDFYRSFLPVSFYDNTRFKANGIAGQMGILTTGITLRL